MPSAPLAPNSDLIQLGKGQILFAPIEAGVRGAYFHLGNSEQFEISIEADVVEKFSSQIRSAPLYKRVTRRQTTSLKIQMDEWSKENLALFLMGQVAEYTQAATAVTGELLTNDVKEGGYYKFARLGPYTGITLTTGATPLVLGTDYRIVDPILGVIQILVGAPNIANDDPLTAAYTPTAYTAGTTSRDAIFGGVKSIIEGSVLFIPDPSSGLRWGCEVWRASSTPDGAIGLISEEFGSFTVDMAVQDDAAGVYGGSSSAPLYRMIHYPAAPA